MSVLGLFLRPGSAAILGRLVGLERQQSDKAAGLRTQMLVSLGSAPITIVSSHGFIPRPTIPSNYLDEGW